MGDILYILNDPTTVNLMVETKLPAPRNIMKVKVDGFSGPTNDLFSNQWQAACCEVSLAQAVAVFNKYLETPVTKWAATNNLIISPRAGRQLNAYYDRKSLRFFYALDPITQNNVFAVNSTDVVMHETGHALLDAVRPDLFNTQAMEVWGFHEAFGDINALINSLQHKVLIDYMLEETKGDLNKTNIVSKLAEEMGTAIFNLTGGSQGHTAGFLRNAVNNFVYSDPEKLPRNGKDNQLTGEAHSFSRVFTGAWYEILVEIYNQEKTKNGLSSYDAIVKATDVMARYIFRALRLAPATVKFYDAVAKAMLIVDKANSYEYNSIMNKVFVKRKILRKSIRPLMSAQWSVFQATLLPGEDEVLNDNNVVAVRNKKTTVVPLVNQMLNVEIPNDVLFEFDKNGDCVAYLSGDISKTIKHATKCVEFLKTENMIRPDKSAPFEIDEDGNLIRTHFACGCANNNAIRYGQPEFNKMWKSANNAGCSCKCKNKAPCNGISSTTTVTTSGGCGSCGTTAVSSCSSCGSTSAASRIVSQRNLR